MTRFAAIAAVMAISLGLSACAGFQLQNARNMSPSGSTFQQGLYSGYLALSQAEFDEADYADSDTFAARAMAAAGGKVVEPEALSARDLPADKVSELRIARNWLTDAFGRGGIEKAPGAAARAQVAFDCWMQEQEENIQPEDVEACKERFEAAMAEMEAALKEPMAKKPEPMPQPTALPGPYLVLFDFGMATLTSEAKATIGLAAAAVERAKPSAVNVSGHTDTVGSSRANDVLSKKRADAVAAELIAQGVSPSLVVKSIAGEEDQRVATPDNTREAGNRRVEITFTR